MTKTPPIDTEPAFDPDNQFGVDPIRRHLLQAVAICVALLPTVTRADDDDPRRKTRPQPGDLLVRSSSDQEAALIVASDIKLGDAPITAWAMDPAQKLVRDGSRLNQVLLLRLDPSALSPETRAHAADGLVAYSAICTHAQCGVTDWISDKQILHCPCHQSEYDPRQDAKVVAGPAPRALAALPIKITDGKVQVVGLFIGRIGMDKPMM